MSVPFGDQEGAKYSKSMHEDLYIIKVYVTITEAEPREANTEFSGSLNEIDGGNSFPCYLCNKVCIRRVVL